MRVLVVEDEVYSGERLISLIKDYESSVEIAEVLGSVQDTIQWFTKNTPPDLIFMDIHLSDGSCFEIFKAITVESPIIFTTAYDHYAIQAFKVNSIDYIMKPIDPPALKQALEKYKKLSQASPIPADFLDKLKNAVHFKEPSRIVARINDQLLVIKTEDIGYVSIIDSSVFVHTFHGTKVPIDQSLEQMEGLLNKEFFFRINRKTIINLHAIKKISSYFNGRYVLHLALKNDEGFIVSRNRASEFKKWLEG